MRELIDVGDAVKIVNSNFPDGVIKRTIIDFLRSMPVIEQRQVAVWIHEESGGFMLPMCHCSACETYVQQESKFCPVCGAEMKNAAQT